MHECRGPTMGKKRSDRKQNRSRLHDQEIPLNSKEFTTIFNKLTANKDVDKSLNGIKAFWLQNNKKIDNPKMLEGEKKSFTEDPKSQMLPNDSLAPEHHTSISSSVPRAETLRQSESQKSYEKSELFRSAFNNLSRNVVSNNINVSVDSFSKVKRLQNLPESIAPRESHVPKSELHPDYHELYSSKTPSGPSNVSECVICCSLCRDPDIVTYKCDHQICSVCACRLIYLYEDYNCPICLKKTSPNIDQNITANLLKIECILCKKRFKTKMSLVSHYSALHKKLCCDLCVESQKSFPSEWTLYTNRDMLERHKRHGSYRENVAGFSGHFRCAFCRLFLYDYKAFVSHMRNAHSICTICERSGRRHVYYKNTDLASHLSQDHYTCGFEGCEGIAFLYPTELYEHNIKIHRIVGTAVAPFMEPKGSKLQVVDILELEDKMKAQANQKIYLIKKCLFYKYATQNTINGHALTSTLNKKSLGDRTYQEVYNDNNTSCLTQPPEISPSHDKPSEKLRRNISTNKLDENFSLLSLHQSSTRSSKVSPDPLGDLYDENGDYLDNLDGCDLSQLRDSVAKYESEQFLRDLYAQKIGEVSHQRSPQEQSPRDKKESTKSSAPRVSKSREFPRDKPERISQDMKKVVVVKVPKSDPSIPQSKVIFVDKNLVTENLSTYLVRNRNEQQLGNIKSIKNHIQNMFPVNFNEIVQLFVNFSRKEIDTKALFQNIEKLIGNKSVIKLMQKIIHELDPESKVSVKEYLPGYIDQTNFPNLFENWTPPPKVAKKRYPSKKPNSGYRVINFTKKKPNE